MKSCYQETSIVNSLQPSVQSPWSLMAFLQKHDTKYQSVGRTLPYVGDLAKPGAMDEMLSKRSFQKEIIAYYSNCCKAAGDLFSAPVSHEIVRAEGYEVHASVGITTTSKHDFW